MKKLTFTKSIKLLVLLLLLTGITEVAHSQYYYDDRNIYFELGLGAGAMNCITDVGGANSDKEFYINEIRSKNFKSSYSIYAGVIIQDFIGARLEGTFGQVTSADNVITSKASLNLISKNVRNLNFRSNISEVALLAEFHPLLIKYREEGPLKISPYAIAGVGFFSFNPQTLYNGAWINLQPLHTEGQGFAEFEDRVPYKLSQFNIPFGIGVRYELSSMLNIRLEYVHRKLFTDYLDDASSRKNINPALYANYMTPVLARFASALANPSKDGDEPPRRANPNDKDAYMTLSLKLGISLGRTFR